MKQIKDIFHLYIGSKAKTTREADFAKWLLDPHDSEAKDRAMEELWKETSSNASSVHAAKRKVDSVLFPERASLRRYRIAMGSVCAVAACLAAALILTYSFPSISDDVNYIETSTLSGQSSEVLLEDGTKVILNSQSKLIYPEKFSSGQRKVFLTGEAVFDVAKDEDRPFVVNVSGYSIEVLGTVFNVADYMGDAESTIALKQGRIKVNVPGAEPIFLSSDQGIVYDKVSGTVAKVNVDASSAMSWSDGVMCFEGSDIYEIIKMAERIYGVKIVCSDHPKYTNAKITARFETCGEVRTLLEVLEKLIPEMHYSQTGQVIYLK